MPPSGSKPTDGAVDVYGHHESIRLRRFALKMEPYRPVRRKWLPQGEDFSFHPDRLWPVATVREALKLNKGMRIALFQPDIAGNTGTILRMAACLGLAVDIIEPAGFDISDRALKRAGMDYLEMAALTRHLDFARFEEWRPSGRPPARAVVDKGDDWPTPNSTSPAAISCCSAANSAGVPDHVRDAADAGC